MIEEACPRNGRSAPVEFLNFPADAVDLIGTDGAISGTCDDCEILYFPGKHENGARAAGLPAARAQIVRSLRIPATRPG